MTKQDDGGLAYPQPYTQMTGEDHGMTLLDYFAGQALVALGNWAPRAPGAAIEKWPEPAELKRLRAEWAYEQAAAMLKARAVTSQERHSP